MTGALDGGAGPWRRRGAWALLAIAVIAGVLVVINRQSRIGDLQSRNRALEARLGADPGVASDALARVSARAAAAEQDARDMIRALQLQQGRVEALNRRLAAGQIQGAVVTGRQVATCQVAAVRASSAASSVANAMSGLAGTVARRAADEAESADVRLIAADSAFGQAQRSWVNAEAALEVCAR